jgi:uncharacterized protein (DUF1330 family)
MEPSAHQLAHLAAVSDGPVVMLNLVKFGGDGSREAYARYSKGFVPLLKACGGTVLWAGHINGVAIGSDREDDWDYVVLVRYPHAQAFVDTITTAAYAAINPERMAGLTRHVILPVTESYSKLNG